MAYWFHRNPLKSTVKVNFDLKMVTAGTESVTICSELKRNRDLLIENFSNADSSTETVEAVLNNYLSLLLGFVKPLDGRGGDSSKLRHSLRFKWTQSMLGSNPIVQQDAIYEMISMCQEYGIWLMKHGSVIAGKDEISMDEAKLLHKCLRKSAGVFKAMQDGGYIDRLLDKPEPGSDNDPRIINAYILQCTAEAQEVTIARAMELKHSAKLISGLANETSRTFLAAGSSIKALDAIKFGRWLHYFRLKSELYLSLAYCYHGEDLLALEKCGEAIKALEISETSLTSVSKLSKEYSKMKGPGVAAKLEQHLFFRTLKPLILRTKDKCIRENGLIFHQKVALEVPGLEMKATHGIVSPEQFTLPEINALWASSAYSSFDLSKNVNPKDPANSKAAQKAEGPIPPLEEKEVPHSKNDPKNQSGCRLQ